MDCYYHTAVPSVALCRDCREPVCATCRDAQGLCPGCRLEQRMHTAAASRPRLRGKIGPSHPPPPSAPPPWPPAPTRIGPLATVSGETRALLALGYVLWPLAALALLDPTRSRAVRRQAIQALGLNFGLFGLWVALGAVAQIPLLGWPAFPLLAALFPVWLIATLVYGVRVWNAEPVRVPLLSDWLDEREARRADTVAA